MFITDAHLDLAYNALRGREVLKRADEQTPDEEGIPTVGLPDLRAGNVGLICATIFCEPALGGKNGYRTADEAAGTGWRQLQWYLQQASAGEIEIVTSPDTLPGHNNDLSRSTGVSPVSSEIEPRPSDARPPLKTILLLEGADPLRTPDDLPAWFNAGLRIVGLSWKQTRYAGGTGSPGPLTLEGVELVKALDEFHIIHDLSHLAEESVWQLLDLTPGPVMASHSNCRAIIPTDRHLTDEMIKAIVARGGVIGINFYGRFLLRPAEHGTRRATLADVIHQIRHICDLAGNARHVGLGTDMDGGIGREQIPQEIRTAADLPRLAEALNRAQFSDQDVRAITGENWLQFFRKALPQNSMQPQSRRGAENRRREEK